MIKVDGRWREVSWDAAFRRCTELLRRSSSEYGIGAVTAYIGNPLAHTFSLGRYTGVLMGMSGMPVIYSPGTVDQWPKNLSSHLMYGRLVELPGARHGTHRPDGDHGRQPRRVAGLAAGRARRDGPDRRNPQARQGDRRRPGAHAPPTRPTSGCRSSRAPTRRCCWPSRTRCSTRTWSIPGRTSTASTRCAGSPRTGRRAGSAVTGIDAERIRRLARELAGTEKAVVYGRIGLCNQEFGSLASWLVDVVNVLTGHFDTPGGAMFPRPAAWSITTQPLPGLEGGVPEFGRWHTRVRGARRCWARRRCRAWPRRSRPPARGSSRR